jgi:peptide/nickel transport system permease protein
MRMLRRCLRSGRVLVGLAIALAVLACAVLAPVLAPADPGEQDLLHILLPPAWANGGDAAFPLGTDSLGRCVLSRLLYGARTAMTVAVLASLGAMLIGSILAHAAGYLGGAVDWTIGRVVDVWMSFPPVILSLVLMVGLGTGLDKVILAIVLVDWTRFCRVLRSEVLVVKQRDYVAAARLIGFSQAAWGQMIADARQHLYESPSGLLFPMAAIFVTVTGFNLLGDGLRRALDIRLAAATER